MTIERLQEILFIAMRMQVYIGGGKKGIVFASWAALEKEEGLRKVIKLITEGYRPKFI